MDSVKLINLVRQNFSSKYLQYRAFSEKEEYKEFWNLCLDAINDDNFLLGVIFCNDILSIPPLKVFLTFYKQELIQITRNSRAILPLFVKRSLGSFWSMIFKSILGYTNQEILKINTGFYFDVKTASYYIK